MTHGFDKAYWELHWRQAGPSGARSVGGHPPNPYLARETGDLVPGTALDAGCGAGAEAIWLASRGWHVTAVDISSAALAGAVEREAVGGGSEQVRWVEADLSRWDPGRWFDLVTTHYAHPAMPQLEFYDRIARWVAPGGTLLIVGHLHTHGAANQPAEASATATEITARLDETAWEVVTPRSATARLTAMRAGRPCSMTWSSEPSDGGLMPPDVGRFARSCRGIASAGVLAV